MLDRAHLVRLYREFQERPVLSVYLDVDQQDPAQRRIWKTRLERQASDEIRRVGEEGGDVEGLRASLDHVDEALRDVGFIDGKGWVGFATPQGLHHHESLPVPMPDLVRWETGIRVAPYIRGLKRLRRIAVVVSDRRRVRLFELRNSELHEAPSMVADQDVGDLSDVGMRKRGSRRSGQRGETRTDHAARYLEQSAERLWKDAVEKLTELAGDDGFVVLGGTPETVGRLEGMLPARLADRAETATTLHIDMSLAEVQTTVEGVASVLNKRLQGDLVSDVVDLARAGGKGVLGPDETVTALREMRVDTLLVSRAFLKEHPDLADRCVGTALAQDAEIEEVSGPGAEVLDLEADGMGARLRYRVDEPVVAGR